MDPIDEDGIIVKVKANNLVEWWSLITCFVSTACNFENPSRSMNFDLSRDRCK